MPREVEEYHTFKASGQQFEIPKRYKLIRPIGHGAYGVVISAMDTVNDRQVAIKKIRSAFDDRIDAKRILREIKLMKRFEHENVSTSIILYREVK
jgi:mitogen-activated protein kinase 1/3